MHILHPSRAVWLFALVVPVLAACRSTQPPRPTRPAAVTPPRILPAVERLVPAPVSLVMGQGAPFVIDSATVIAASGDATVAMVAEYFAAILRPSTGFSIPVMPGVPSGARPIVLRIAPVPGSDSEDRYHLSVNADGVQLSAPTGAGLFRGVQTLRQLLPAAIESHMRLTGALAQWSIAPVTIVDYPRFSWRGAMLDVSRHFFTVAEVKEYIDILALYKMNRFHIHLSDDQGWRIEIKSRPQLANVGGATEVGGGTGGFYTQAEYAEIVRYAHDRFITVVPEIDMPGHTNAALVAFPNLSCGKWAPALYTGTEVGFSSFCVEKEETYALIDDIVREIAALTPGPYFHMGGDEVEVLTPQQYASFVERVQDIVTKHGKQVVGWEEINKARMLPTSLIQQWRGDTLSPQPGRKLIMSPGRRLYLDMKYDESTELGLKWAGVKDVRTTYDWDPALYNPGVGEASIAGIEAPMWAETLRNITAVQYLLVPRLPSVAEVGWTPQAQRDWESFRRRLASQAPRWNFLGINYHRSVEIPW